MVLKQGHDQIPTKLQNLTNPKRKMYQQISYKTKSFQLISKLCFIPIILHLLSFPIIILGWCLQPSYFETPAIFLISFTSLSLFLNCIGCIYPHSLYHLFVSISSLNSSLVSLILTIHLLINYDTDHVSHWVPCGLTLVTVALFASFILNILIIKKSKYGGLSIDYNHNKSTLYSTFLHLISIGFAIPQIYFKNTDVKTDVTIIMILISLCVSFAGLWILTLTYHAISTSLTFSSFSLSLTVLVFDWFLNNYKDLNDYVPWLTFMSTLALLIAFISSFMKLRRTIVGFQSHQFTEKKFHLNSGSMV